MTTAKSLPTHLLTLAVLSLIALFAAPSQAANTTNNYTGSSTGSLLVSSNWSLSHVPTVSEDAVFTATTGIRTLSNGSLTVGSFNVTANTGTFTIRNATNSTTSTLTLGGIGDNGNGVSGTAADLLYAAGGSTFNLTGSNSSANLNIVLGQSGNFDAVGAININVNAVISDGGNNYAITANGAGTLTLSSTNTSSSNTFGGGVTLSAGTLNITNGGTSSTNSAIGTGTLTINGGTIENTSTNAVTLATNNAQTWGGDFSYAGSSNSALNLGTGAVTLTGNRTISNLSGSTTNALTVGGAIGDGGHGYSLSRLGGGLGTLILTGNSTYSGGTTIGAGTFSVSSLGMAGASGNLGTGGISLGNTTADGTLLYTGGGETTNKVFNLNGTTGGGIIDTTGATGALILSANLTATGAGIKTLTLKGSNTGNTISGAIVDNAPVTSITNLVKSGAGSWILSGSNTYTGTTSVSAGSLIVNGSITGSSLTTVSDAGVVAGTGTIGALTLSGTAAGGAIDPGNGAASVASNGTVTGNGVTGKLTTGALILSGSAHFSMQLGGTTAGTGYDQVIASSVKLAGDAQVHLINGYTPTAGDTLYLVLNSGSSAVSGTFANIDGQAAIEGATVSIDGSQFTLTYLAHGDSGSLGNDIALTTAVPEPETSALMIGSLGLLACWQRFRRGSGRRSLRGA